MKYYIILFFKGMAMGIANVIPGVSGGTMALITQIYEELIDSLKSFDKEALRLIISGDITAFKKHTKLNFLLTVLGGSVASMFSIANLFEYLLEHQPVLIWAFFFGLIIASIYFVGKRIKHWQFNTVTSLVIGVIVALSLTFINPAGENDNIFFVFLCGIIGISGMMLPGLSGSFILILMGNYELLMVRAITEMNIILLSVFALGSIFGLMSFSHILSWIFKYYKDATLALLTGFIIGSLNVVWPWKRMHTKYSIELPSIPNEYNQETILAFTLIVVGIIIVYAIEKFESKKD